MAEEMKFEGRQFDAMNVDYGLEYSDGDSIRAEELGHIVNGVLYNSELIDNMQNSDVNPRVLLMGPEEGAYGEDSPNNAPEFRRLVPSDLPDLSAFLGILKVVNGGTGKGLGGNNIVENMVLATTAANVFGRMLTDKLGTGDELVTSEMFKFENELGFLWRYKYDGDKKTHIIKMPIRVGDSYEYVTLQYGIKNITMSEGATSVELSERYSDTNYMVMLSSGRDNSDEWGVDTMYARVYDEQNIWLVKDHYYSAHELDVHWMTLGK